MFVGHCAAGFGLKKLKDRMEQAGFKDVTLYGNLDGHDYGPNAQRLIAVGRRGCDL
ncbi:MAG: hypothetical protein HQ559_09795 [Lentisphaerae bacterium]|nr:hypothetical protein [Lentisphaerota bacterium]